MLEPIVVHFQAEQSNDLWQMDFTPSELKKLHQSDSPSDKGLMLASLVDDRSGVLYQEYFLSDGETALMALQFLFNAMAPKKQKNFPFQGIFRKHCTLIMVLYRKAFYSGVSWNNLVFSF